MGAYTSTAKVWYPDTTDSAKLDTVIATVASSIENGLGARMTLRETQVGIKAGVGTAWTLPSTLTLVPFAVGTGNGMFNNGFTISSGGVVTVQTPGQYYVSGALSITNVAGHTVKMELHQNGTPLIYDEISSSSSFYQFAKGSTVINCVAGDTISMYGGDAVGGSTTVADNSKNHLSVVLVNATHT